MFISGKNCKMELDTENLEETLRFLIQNADPNGLNYRKLTKILSQVERNVFIGPKTRRYISECVQKFDNVECEHMMRHGNCRIKKGRPQCEYKKRFSRCPSYSEVKSNAKGNPIKLGG